MTTRKSLHRRACKVFTFSCINVELTIDENGLLISIVSTFLLLQPWPRCLLSVFAIRVTKKTLFLEHFTLPGSCIWNSVQYCRSAVRGTRRAGGRAGGAGRGSHAGQCAQPDDRTNERAHRYYLDTQPPWTRCEFLANELAYQGIHG